MLPVADKQDARLTRFSLRDSKLARVPIWAVLGLAMIVALIAWPPVDYGEREPEVTYLPLPQPVHDQAAGSAAQPGP
jgi:hypothetical protein